MTTVLPRSVDKGLRAAVAGLEMEISDAVLEDLLTAIADQLQANSDNSAATMLLLAMDSVARHVDTLRVRSDLRAFSLIDELWKAYEDIHSGQEDQRGCREIASAEMKKVLDWQRQCYFEAAADRQLPQSAGKGRSSLVAELVQQQLAETGSLVEQEVASLQQLIGGLAPVSFHRAEVGQQVSSAIAEQVGSLREFLSQEMSTLRQELRRDGGQA